MTLNANAFAKCAPAISTNIKQCGSVALCDAIPLTTDDLSTVYQSSGDMRVLDALLMSDFEIKQCEANQNGLYEFLMANKVNMSHKVVPQGVNADVLQIAPFIKADQYSPINNEFWLVSAGEASGNYWSLQVTSPTNIPADTRTFPAGRRVHVFSTGEGGVRTESMFEVVSCTDNGDDTLTLVIDAMNAATNLDAGKTDDEPCQNGVQGYLRVGPNNVSDFEKNCDEQPAYLNNKLVPFWMQTMRWSYCNSSAYQQYRELMLKTNALYRKFFDLPETKRNQQLMATQQKHWVNHFFFAKPISANQTLADFTSLEDITAFDGSSLGLGVDGGICVGKRAEATGVLEQLAECGRVVDLAGGALNLPALFVAFYNILRVRESQGNRNRIVDVFTDTFTAELINRAMIKYYASKSADHNDATTLRLNMPVEGFSTAKKANFGFYYKSYPLFTPQGAVMNVITHYAFDDELDVANLAGIKDSARMLWVLDFSGIYPGIIGSSRVIAETGRLQDLSRINSDFACVMKVHTQTQSLFSMTYAVVVECPAGNLIIENFNDDVPEITETEGLTYPTTTTTTTPTTPR